MKIGRRVLRAALAVTAAACSIAMVGGIGTARVLAWGDHHICVNGVDHEFKTEAAYNAFLASHPTATEGQCSTDSSEPSTPPTTVVPTTAAPTTSSSPEPSTSSSAPATTAPTETTETSTTMPSSTSTSSTPSETPTSAVTPSSSTSPTSSDSPTTTAGGADVPSTPVSSTTVTPSGLPDVCSPTGNTTVAHLLPCGPDNPAFPALCAVGSPYLTDAGWATIVDYWCHERAPSTDQPDTGFATTTTIASSLPSTGANPMPQLAMASAGLLGGLGLIRLSRRPTTKES